MFSSPTEAVSTGLEEPTRPVSFSDTYGPAHKHLQRCFPEALKVGDIIRIDPYDLEITHIRPATSTQGETEYILSTTHYFFVWPVESTLCVRADNRLLLKKRV